MSFFQRALTLLRTISELLGPAMFQTIWGRSSGLLSTIIRRNVLCPNLHDSLTLAALHPFLSNLTKFIRLRASSHDRPSIRKSCSQKSYHLSWVLNPEQSN